MFQGVQQKNSIDLRWQINLHIVSFVSVLWQYFCWLRCMFVFYLVLYIYWCCRILVTAKRHWEAMFVMVRFSSMQLILIRFVSVHWNLGRFILDILLENKTRYDEQTTFTFSDEILEISGKTPLTDFQIEKNKRK